MDTDKKIDDMTSEELRAELKRLKDSLCDVEDLHSFTFGKTAALHISAEKAQNMQIEFEEECRAFKDRIADIEKKLRERGAL